ncbi:hypothetical protein AM500_06920 [Bacillus sp. FJAT-18017]|uniref:DUF3298 and DUF4163 domain-containing protein n=1 Tax=Bacillus sp. FJAT-18017 TaxID=1705566 RepID=UPI0006BDE862|nr:DUF3298 and DUF4163 domain-containing protein [Bacillus sp. FJAT-18017]ALC89545.1 hypothetical protein AM500_06920 [Bacillus sp. FJAT-18017]
MPFHLPVYIGINRIRQPNLAISIPYVYGLMNSIAEKAIHNDILRVTRQLIQKSGYYENQKTEITGVFDLKTNERGVLSLTLEQYSYAGGAHGITYISGLTWDSSTGRLYRLDQLFKPGSNYVKVLSEMVAAQIKERSIMTIEPFTSIKPNQDYYIADKALVLFFQLYDLAPYAYGFPYFPISIYSIQDLISEQSPLQKMFG